MFMNNWSRRQRRTFWVLVSVFMPILIGIVGALGSWMNVPEFRRITGLDPLPPSPTPPAVAKLSSTPAPRAANRAAPSPSPAKPQGNSSMTEIAAVSQPQDKTAHSGQRVERIETASVGGNPFYIDSIGDTSFGIGARLEGVWRARPDLIEVEIPRPLLRLHSRAYHQGPRRLDSIKVSIGTFDCAVPWRSPIKRESQAVHVGRMMSPGENAELGPLRFSIPRKGLGDLSGNQLIVQIENEALATGANGNKTRSYAYTDAGVFGKNR